MPTAIKKIEFSNFAEGATITATGTLTSSTGDTSNVTVTDSTTGDGLPSVTFNASRKMIGSRGARIQALAADILLISTLQTAQDGGSGQTVFRIDSTRQPSVQRVIGRLRSGSGNVAIFVMTPAGVTSLQTAGGTGLKNFNGGVALPNGIYCVNLLAVKGTTSSNGTIKCYLYRMVDESGGSLATGLVDSYESTTTNAGTVTIAAYHVGKPNSGTADDFDLGLIQFQTFATGETPTEIAVPSANTAPTVSVDAAVTAEAGRSVTHTATGADSDGTIAAYAWSQTAGTTVALTGASTATVSYTAPLGITDSTVTLQCIVTDNGGATGNASVSDTIRKATVQEKLGDGTWSPRLARII